eukprot:CAMPEP_0179912992 /NCGR_PEP_ID=MMETSP0983-20121128/209_1 /TAXON_ID=483367 /ORGANISM="non described non described, Strain CCMP 2436" /LENGTH=178 /DNA_ID=CAMNT_0021814925 /DNA_START=23 /DNA_END=556 /DNA_ORIENTATION=-
MAGSGPGGGRVVQLGGVVARVLPNLRVGAADGNAVVEQDAHDYAPSFLAAHCLPDEFKNPSALSLRSIAEGGSPSRPSWHTRRTRRVSCLHGRIGSGRSSSPGAVGVKGAGVRAADEGLREGLRAADAGGRAADAGRLAAVAGGRAADAGGLAVVAVGRAADVVGLAAPEPGVHVAGA